MRIFDAVIIVFEIIIARMWRGVGPKQSGPKASLYKGIPYTILKTSKLLNKSMETFLFLAFIAAALGVRLWAAFGVAELLSELPAGRRQASARALAHGDR